MRTRAGLRALVSVAALLTSPFAFATSGAEAAAFGGQPRAIANGLELLDPLAGPDERFAPARVSVDPLGALFALDRAQGQLQRWDSDHGWTAFGVGEQGGPRSAHLAAIEASWGTEILVLDPTGPTLFRFDLGGRFSGSVDLGAELARAADPAAGSFDRASLEGGITDAVDVTLGLSGDLLLLDRAGRLLQFDREGRYQTDLLRGATGENRPESPSALVRDRDGAAYLLDPVNGRVHRVTRQGALLPPWSCIEGLRPKSAAPGALSALPRGGVVVMAHDGSWIRLFGPDGDLDYHGEIGPLAGTEVVDLAAGPDDVLYVARPTDAGIARIRVVYRAAERAR